MQGEIKDYVQQCSVCNEYAHEQQKETDVTPTPHTSLDLFSYASQDFLLMVDHYSDFWEIDLLPDCQQVRPSEGARRSLQGTGSLTGSFQTVEVSLTGKVSGVFEGVELRACHVLPETPKG